MNEMTVRYQDFFFGLLHILEWLLEKPATQKLQWKKSKSQEKPTLSCQKIGKGIPQQDRNFLRVNALLQQNIREETMSHPYLVEKVGQSRWRT